MSTLSNYQGVPVLILGLGSYPHGSGAAAAEWLARRGAAVVATDLKPAAQLHQPTLRRLRRLGVRFVLGRHQLSDVKRARLIVRNPAVPDSSPLVRYAKKLRRPITNDIGLFLEALRERFPVLADVPLIAVTGTRGKSTTTALIGAILRRQFGAQRVQLGGNIGVSPLFFLNKIKREAIVVLEMSSWLLRDLVKPAFHIAVVTNIFPDHLNYYGTMAAYARDKTRIFLGQTSGDFAVLNRYDPRVRRLARKTNAKVRWFGAKFVTGCVLRGEHNYYNVGAAWEVGRTLGVTEKTMRQVVCAFKPLPNRLEVVRQYRGRLLVNDTTATTPDATIAALHSFTQPIILIAGGNSKGLPLHRLRAAIKQRTRHLILLPGNATKNFPAGVNVKPIPQAVQAAWNLSRPGDVILLSPGVTWLPLMNEFERGRQFVRAVKSLK